MRLSSAIAVISASVVFFADAASAQVANSFVRRNGMETAWKSQVQLPRFGRGLVSSHLYADAQNSRQYAIVELSDRMIRVPADLPDRDGNPIGLEAAKQQAQELASRVLGKPDGFEVVEATVPQIKLVLVTSDGLVQTLDAESGQLIWSTPCGNLDAPAHPAAISPLGIAVIHGTDLYVLDWQTGKLKMVKPLRYATSNSIAICGDLAFVTDYTGRVETYGLKETRPNPYTYVIAGRTVGQPVTLADNLFSAFASDLGYMYVFAGGDRPTEWLRYESASRITGSLAAGNNAFYIGNEAGVLEKITVDERLGRIEWIVRTAEPLTSPPLVMADNVIVASDTGSVVAIDDTKGLMRWSQSFLGARQPIAVCGNKVFCTTKAEELLVLDNESGRVLDRSQTMNLSRPMVNSLTDRVYIINQAGQIQCLRPVGAELPTLIGPVAPAPPEEESVGESPASGQPSEEASSPGSGSPFGAGSSGGDPFADPFGTAPSSDPFGGGGAGAADPFGGSGAGGAGGSDPFGGAGAGGAGAGDPFGGSGGASDPFGGSGSGSGDGGSDPFGGGGGMDDPFGTGTSGPGSSSSGTMQDDPFGSDPF